MNAHSVQSTFTTRMAFATLVTCASIALLPGTAQADILPRAHMAIDGLALRLGEPQHSIASDRRDAIDATGIRLRAGIEFGRPGYGLASRGWHRGENSRGRGGRTESRRVPRHEGAPAHERGPRLGLEMHVAFTRTERDSTRERTDVSLFGGYLTGRAPLGAGLSIKGLAGLTSANIERTEGGLQADARQTGVGYGVGLEASLNRHTDLTVDWMRYLADDAARNDGFERIAALAVGFKIRF